MKPLGIILLTSTSLLMWSSQNTASAQTAEKKPAETKPDSEPESSWSDPLFEKHVSLELLDQAISQGNPSQLTDCALQFARAEQILHRHHPAVSADELMEMAMKMAADQADTDALKRLAKAAEIYQKEALAKQIQNINKLVKPSRTVDPHHAALASTLLDSSVETFTEIKRNLAAMKVAQTLGEETALKNQVKMVTTHPLLNEKQRELLGELVKEALARVNKSKTSPALLKLQGVSRSCPLSGRGGRTSGWTTPGQGWRFVPSDPIVWRRVSPERPDNPFGRGGQNDPGQFGRGGPNDPGQFGRGGPNDPGQFGRGGPNDPGQFGRGGPNDPGPFGPPGPGGLGRPNNPGGLNGPPDPGFGAPPGGGNPAGGFRPPPIFGSPP